MTNQISVSSHGDELIFANSGLPSIGSWWAQPVPQNLRGFSRIIFHLNVTAMSLFFCQFRQTRPRLLFSHDEAPR